MNFKKFMIRSLKKSSVWLCIISLFYVNEGISQEKPHWSLWFIVKRGQNEPFAFFHERVETISKKNQIKMNVDIKKKEEGYINKESFVGLSKANQNLTPISFQFKSTYRSHSYQMEANIQDQDIKASIIEGDQPPQSIESFIHKQTVLSSFFPLWVRHHFSALKEGKKLALSVMKIQPFKSDLNLLDAIVKKLKPDALAKKKNALKIQVKFNSEKSIWWVKKNGHTLKVKKTNPKIIIQQVPKSKALDVM